ncbi:hypothetical protein BZG36_03759 [Bifiguratus adelaidae]|uniref:Nucleolar protein 12 n=1 Tax=Bifiguratus adelaidae TaxID=1938954 RepID=A0A261Y079_9FUNG|nr:hypothetical protein BZG36_03759 [Bifiguratus adelaidae]
MTDYVPGSLSATLFGSAGDKGINKAVDKLFKSSSGAPPFATPIPPPSLKVSTENASDAKKTTKAKVKVRSDKAPAVKNDVQSETKAKSTSSTKRKPEAGESSYSSTDGAKSKKVKKAHVKLLEDDATTKTAEIPAKPNMKSSSSKKTKAIDGDTTTTIKSDVKKVDAKPETKADVGEEDDSGLDLVHETITRQEDEQKRLARTAFIGNVPVLAISKAGYKKFKNLLSGFGPVESIRFRSIAFAELLPRRIAFITAKLHPERDSLNAYVVFKDIDDQGSAIVDKCVAALNGTLWEEKHLRADRADSSKAFDKKRSVFIGNLAFDASEEQLWHFFKDCGEVENVRIVRDKKTNLGKGFAYVQFKSRDAITLALKLAGTKLGKQKLRIDRCKVSKSELEDSDTSKNKVIYAKSRKAKNDKQTKGKARVDKSSLATAPAAKLSEGTRAVKPTAKVTKTKKPRIRERTQAYKKRLIGGAARSKKEGKKPTAPEKKKVSRGAVQKRRIKN